MMLSTSIKVNPIRNITHRRTLHMASVLYTEGATAETKDFGKKEKAAESQWARKHDAELLEKLKKSLAEQEKKTTEIKEKLAELEGKQKK
ncbi:hypothetical protein G6F37_000056 [Rhizopus arrhizus]|nr:hypothetical protein G6F38_002124 [Rhizopus arrhizus]KAG1164667.1 hypothetical protein G6F37_000056 [Rhizopus arrhizus]